MKRLFLLFTCVAVLFLVSCQKEVLQQSQNGEQEVATRVITGYFANATKTELGEDGVTPHWKKDDVIRILGATGYEDITLTEDNILPDGKFICTTRLKGELLAVYPASVSDDDHIYGSWVNFHIPGVQDGSFANANICVAKGDSNNSLRFLNATSIVKFTQTSAETGVKTIRMTKLSPVVGNSCCHACFQEDGSIVIVNDDPSNDPAKMIESPEAKDVYYLAVYSAYATGAPITYTIEMMQNVKIATDTRTSYGFSPNTIYNFGSMDGFSFGYVSGYVNWHYYVQIGTTKWATENLSVTESGARIWKGKRTDGTNTGVCVGDYFQWAAYKGYAEPDSPLIYSSFENAFVEGCGPLYPIFGMPRFGIFNCFAYKSFFGFAPYMNDSSEKYKNAGDVLESGDDIAAMEWGGKWHIPSGGTDGEFAKLLRATCWQWDAVDMGYYVFEPLSGDEGKVYPSGNKYDKTHALLFFPACGYGAQDNLFGNYINGYDYTGDEITRTKGYYLTNTAATYPYMYFLELNDEIRIDSMSRWQGCSIRPCI